MELPVWFEIATFVGLTVLLLADLAIVARRPHEPSVKEASLWVSFYVGLALVFGLVVLAVTNGQFATEFYAGWLTEYSLSVDNLFVFVIIMARFQVPRKLQQEALMVGIIIALILRGIFILLGAAVIERFIWVFYLFGAFLVYTAINLVRHRDEDEEYEENAFIRRMRKVLPITAGLPRREDPGDRGRQEALDADDRRLPGAGDDRPALRPRQHPGDLRPHQRAVHRLHRERLRAHGPAPAVLPARRPAQAAGVPVARAWRSSSPSSASSWSWRRCTRTSCRSSTAASRIDAVPEIPIWLSLTVILGVLVVATVASLLKTRGELAAPASAGRRPETAESVATGGPAAAAAAESRVAETDEERARRADRGCRAPPGPRLASAPCARRPRACSGRRAYPTVSPDGRMAVVAVARPDLDADEYRSQLWAVPTDASAPARPMTPGHRDSAPAFSPDGRWLAYLGAEPGGTAADLAAADGGRGAPPADRPPPRRRNPGLVAGLPAAGLRRPGPRAGPVRHGRRRRPRPPSRPG